MNTVERARGHWREILPRFGIAGRFLQNRHGPCPLCGGKDRYRFDDKDGSGSYYCNQCGAGTGIILIRKLKGWDYATACREIDKIIGTTGPCQPRPVPCGESHDRLKRIERVIAGATDGAIIESYLAGRGLNARSTVLRGHRRLYHAEAKKCLPAVVCPIIGPDGSLRSAHRIYLADIKPRKSTMPAVGTINGGAVRLFPAAEEMGVGEGVETCLAAVELFGVPTWSALTATGVETFEPPPEVKHLHIYGDNDPNYAGQAAAYKLANRLCAKSLEVEVHIPPTADTDWLDVLNGRSDRA
jgi:putative DNA primase/helicase